MEKNPIKLIKQWLATILTLAVILTLFGIIFVRIDLITLSASFFLELSIVVALTLMMKVWWYNYGEDKRLSEKDIKDAKEHYFKMVDENIKDTNDLEKYLIILNKENREHYVHNKIGSRTPENLAKKTKLMCLFNPLYKRLSEKEIGHIRYNKLYIKAQRKADKLKPIKSDEIMALSDTEILYDSKNHLKEKKRIYQISTTIISIILTTFLASLALKEILLNWENVVRYVGYLCAMIWTIATTLITSYKMTGEQTFDHLNRLKFIIDKYATYKEALNKNEQIDSNSVRLCKSESGATDTTRSYILGTTLTTSNASISSTNSSNNDSSELRHITSVC